VFPENRASLSLHHSAGYRTLAVRSRIAQLDGVWRDTVLLERTNQTS
jgi:L-amino acid N-acyltransferase YncA